MPNKLSQEYVEKKVAVRDYELRSIYKSAHVKMDIYCKKCNEEFQQTWANFGAGHGCPQCAINERADNHRTPFSEVKNQFNIRGFVLLSEESDYIDNASVLQCICSCGKKGTKRYYDLLANKKCNECAKERLSEMFRTKKDVADKIANNQDLTIIEYTYRNINDPILVECKKCKLQFSRSLSSMKCNGGCPQCKCSYGERKLLKYVKSLGLKYKQEYKFQHDPKNGANGCRNIRDLPFDVMIKTNSGKTLLIEIDGIQHFQCIGMFGGMKARCAQIKSDLIKSTFCYNNNIPLLRISYMDIDNIEQLVSDFISAYKNGSEEAKLFYSDISIYNSFIKAFSALCGANYRIYN